MNTTLTDFDKNLLNLLQAGIEPMPKPFAVVAQQLTSAEANVLAAVRRLSEAGFIKRISATVDYSRLGKISALVTAHIEASAVDSVGSEISALPGVSHNYIRDHYYNLWFTLQGSSETDLRSTLDPIAKKFAVVFHILPAIRTFKLDVRFDAKSSGSRLLPARSSEPAPAGDGLVTLSADQLALVRKLQQPLPLVSEPFDDVWQTAGLLSSGVIKRIAAVLDYRKLGFAANAMFVCVVKESDISSAGHALAKLDNVSHCYQRPPFANWPYNLFAMLHGPDMQTLTSSASAFASENKITDFALLKTVRELKKSPVSL